MCVLERERERERDNNMFVFLSHYFLHFPRPNFEMVQLFQLFFREKKILFVFKSDYFVFAISRFKRFSFSPEKLWGGKNLYGFDFESWVFLFEVVECLSALTVKTCLSWSIFARTSNKLQIVLDFVESENCVMKNWNFKLNWNWVSC